MGSLTPSGIWVPASSEPVETHIVSGVVAASASDALGGLGSGKRQPIKFVAANQSEKASVALLHASWLVSGDTVFLLDSLWWETFNGSAWVVTKTLVPIPYTPSWLNLSVGNGTNLFAYWVDGDQVTVQGVFFFGTTTTLGSGQTYIPLPLPSAAAIHQQVGVCTANDHDGSGRVWNGIIAVEPENVGMASKLVFRPRFKGLHPGRVSRGYLDSVTPFNWATYGNYVQQFSVLFTYTRA